MLFVVRRVHITHKSQPLLTAISDIHKNEAIWMTKADIIKMGMSASRETLSLSNTYRSIGICVYISHDIVMHVECLITE